MNKLRVCHLITMLEFGGAQQNTLYTVEHLDREEFEPSLIAGPGGLLDEKAAALDGVHFETCPNLLRPVRPGRDLVALLDLKRRLERIAPHVVHTHSSKAGILGRAAALLARVPIIVHTVHGWGFTPLQSAPKRAFFVGLERLGAFGTSQLIAVSAANAEEGARRRIAPHAAFRVIHSGIKIARYADGPARGALRRELGIDDATPLAGMVACLKPQKAPLDYVEVARRVRESLPEAHFFLAGDGEQRAAVESAIDRHDLAGSFHLLGWRDDTEQLLADADVVVLSSRHEGLPRVIPEAMATGRPVVVTAVDGSPEAVEEGVTGHLVAPGDLETLAERLGSLLADPERARAMGRAAQARVGPWDIDTMVRDQEALYRELARQVGLARA